MDLKKCKKFILFHLLNLKNKKRIDSISIQSLVEYMTDPEMNISIVEKTIENYPEDFELNEGIVSLKASYVLDSSRAEYVQCFYNWDEFSINCGLMFELGEKQEKYYYFEVVSAPIYIFQKGENVEKAEIAAWDALQRIKDCKNHEFERRGDEEGFGFCKHCEYKSKVFKPVHNCEICGVKTTNFSINKKHYCLKDYIYLNINKVKGFLSNKENEEFKKQVIEEQQNFKLCYEWLEKNNKLSTLDFSQIKLMTMLVKSLKIKTTPIEQERMLYSIYEKVSLEKKPPSTEFLLNKIKMKAALKY